MKNTNFIKSRQFPSIPMLSLFFPTVSMIQFEWIVKNNIFIKKHALTGTTHKQHTLSQLFPPRAFYNSIVQSEQSTGLFPNEWNSLPAYFVKTADPPVCVSVKTLIPLWKQQSPKSCQSGFVRAPWIRCQVTWCLIKIQDPLTFRITFPKISGRI